MENDKDGRVADVLGAKARDEVHVQQTHRNHSSCGDFCRKMGSGISGQVDASNSVRKHVSLENGGQDATDFLIRNVTGQRNEEEYLVAEDPCSSLENSKEALENMVTVEMVDIPPEFTHMEHDINEDDGQQVEAYGSSFTDLLYDLQLNLE